MDEDFPDTLPTYAFGGDAAGSTEGGEAADQFPDTLPTEAFAGGEDFPDIIPPKDFEKSTHTSTAGGAAARGVAEGAIPGIGGLAAGIKTTAALTPFVSPWVSVPAGLAVGFGAGALLSKGQDYIMDLMGLRSQEQAETDEAQHKYSKQAGEILPSLALLRPNAKALDLGARALGAGIGGAASAVGDLVQNGEVDLGKVAMGAGAGALFPRLNRAGEAIAKVGAPRPGSPRNPLNGEVFPPDPPNKGGPGGKAADMTGDPEIDHNLKFAYESRDGFDTNDPMWRFWDDYVNDLISRGTTKGNPGDYVDASQGPHGDKNAFTYHDADKANDVTTTARGVAAENPPAPNVVSAGNPVGAPMATRVASRPNGPLRDYRKTKTLPAPEGGQESTPISQAPIHEDVSLALANDEPAPRPRQLPAVADEHAQDVMHAEGEGVRRAQMAPREGQVGEAFQEPPVTAAVTPQVSPRDQHVIDTAVRTLQQHGMNEVLAKLNALPPPEQVVAGSKLLHALQSKSGEDTGGNEVRVPKVRPQVNGVMARSQTDAARKQGALDAAKAAFEKFTPTSDTIPVDTAGRLAVVERAKAAFDHAKAAYDGKSPLSYKPRVKPPEWQFVNAAARLVKLGGSVKNITDFLTTEKQLRTGGAEHVQATERVEADIAKRPQLEDSTTDPLISHARAAEETQRTEHEPFTNEKGDESAHYTVGQNRLRDWLNGLDDATHSQLSRLHPDLDLNVKTTHDPVELMHNLMDDLAEQTGKRPGKIELVAAEDVKGKPKPVRTRADLDRFAPVEPGAPASTGRVLDKNSPEFKRLAGQALEQVQRGPLAREVAKHHMPAYDLGYARKPLPAGANDAEQAAHDRGANDRMIADRAPDRLEQEVKAIDGTEKGMRDHIAAFLGEESGAVPMDRAFKWLWEKGKDFWDPQAPTPIQEYGEELGGAFTKLRNRVTQYKGDLKARVMLAPELPPVQWGSVYRAAEKGQVNTALPAPLRDAFNDHVKPILDQYGPWYDELRNIMAQYKMPGWSDMPERTDVYREWMKAIRNQDPGWQGFQQRLLAGEKFNAWFPRLPKGQKWEDIGNYDVLAQRGDSLSAFAPTAQPRTWFSLQNPQGQRVTYIPGDGEITILRNGAPSRVTITSNSFDPRRPGDTIKLKTGGKTNDWTVDHATIDEIKLAAGKDAQGNWKEEYHDNPMLTMVNAVNELHNALERVRLQRDILEHPIYRNNHTKDPKDPRIAAEGWEQSKLPEFKDTWMPKQIAWIMDDFHKPGLNDWTGKEHVLFDRIATAGTKLFYFMGPAIHMFNEADKAFIGRGYNWITPQGYRSLVKNGASAVKSVWTQDATQREMVEAGMNPMMMHTAVTNFMPDVAKKLGVEIERNAKAWDPIARAFNTTTPDLARAAYKLSTKSMWWVSDVLLTMRYLEEKELRGLAPKEAGKSTHEFVDSYIMKPTIGGENFVGRGLKKLLSDPTFSLFSPYHYGVLGSYAHMVKGVVQRQKTPEQRLMAASQLLVLAAMMYWGYPALTAGYRKLTGDKHSEVETRGITRVADTVNKYRKGEKTEADLLRNIWTPSVLVDTVARQFQGKDFRGKDIIQPGGSAAHKLAQEADFLLGQFASPVKQFGSDVMEPGATKGSILKKTIEHQIGVKTPTNAAQKRENRLPILQNREERLRAKHPGGLIEHILRKSGG